MKSRTIIPTLALFAAISFATSLPSQACFMRSPQPVQVWLDHITVNITNHKGAHEILKVRTGVL